MSKGTILYIGGFELPDKNAAAQRVISNSKIFRDLGYKVVLIDTNKDLQSGSDIMTTYKEVQGFDSWSISYPRKKYEWIDFLSNINFVKKIENNYKDIKLIIAYNFPSLALYKLTLYGDKKNIKILADCTEWYSTKGSNLVFKVIKGLDSFFRMRIVQKKVNGIIVISKYLEEYYSKCENVVKIPPLVDLNEKKWQIHKEINGENSEGMLKIIYSGSPGKNKDKLTTIVDALYKLRSFENYQLSIVGITRNQFIYDYPKYYKKLFVLGKRVDFVGRLSHEESLKKIKNSNYSIFIRDKTRLTMAGFPTKFVESISCLTPVITSDSSDIKEYFINESIGVLIKDSSVTGVAKELRNILQKTDHNIVKYDNFDSEVFHYAKYLEVVEVFLYRLMENSEKKSRIN